MERRNQFHTHPPGRDTSKGVSIRTLLAKDALLHADGSGGGVDGPEGDRVLACGHKLGAVRRVGLERVHAVVVARRSHRRPAGLPVPHVHLFWWIKSVAFIKWLEVWLMDGRLVG